MPVNQMIPATNAQPSTGQQLMVGGNETAATAVAAQAKALVEARYTVALHRPRDLDVVRERLLRECKRPSFAAVARYRKPIGAGIEGPSIRFAETAIRCMTNVTVETVTVYDDREKRIVRVMVTDLEANVPYSQDVTIEKTIERRNVKNGDEVLRSRTNSRGEPVHIIVATEDDILNKQNALISKAVRTLGLRLVPGDLIDEAMWQVQQTQKNADAADPDAARLRLYDAFADLGIRVSEIKEYLGHDGVALTPKELAELRGLYAAIRDGETTWREVMDQRGGSETKQPASGRGSVARLKAATGAAVPTDTRTTPAGDGPITREEVIASINTAATIDELDVAVDMGRMLPEADQAAVKEAHRQRRIDLTST